MKRLLATYLVLCALLFGAFQCLQRVQAGTMTLLGVGAPTVTAAAFQGLGDIAGGAWGYFGTEAYSAAKRGTKAINLCNPSDVACADISTDAVTGKLALTTVGGVDCTVSTCTIKTYYDQTGANACGAAACDITQSAITNRPTLTASALNGVPCGAFLGSSSQALSNATGFTQAQPYSVSAVAKRTGANTTAGIIFSSNGAFDNYFFTSTNTVAIFSGGGSAPTATATDAAFHAMQFIMNGAGSSFYIDGTSTSAATAGSITATGPIFVGSDNSGNLLTALVCEVAFYPANNTTPAAAMNSNQHSSPRWNF